MARVSRLSLRIVAKFESIDYVGDYSIHSIFLMECSTSQRDLACGKHAIEANLHEPITT